MQYFGIDAPGQDVFWTYDNKVKYSDDVEKLSTWAMCFPVRVADPVFEPQFNSLARDSADKEGYKMQVIEIALQFIKHISKTTSA